MKLLTNHKTLSRIFIETKTELDETEKSLEKLLGCTRKKCSHLAPKYNKSLPISSCKFPLKRTINELKDSSESAEENASEDDIPPLKKISLRSAVVTKGEGIIASRKDVIRQQNCNTKMKSRNRRIFGMVQNTLQKFQDEAIKSQSQDQKKMEVQQKVEAAVEEERKIIEKQKLELYSKQKEKQLELECLKEMMELTELYEVWKNNHKLLLNYNITDTEPNICFLPASHTSSSNKHFEKSNVKIQAVMQNEKENIVKELSKIIQSYQFPTSITKMTTSLSPESI